jgi:hypothetical protein
MGFAEKAKEFGQKLHDQDTEFKGDFLLGWCE